MHTYTPYMIFLEHYTPSKLSKHSNFFFFFALFLRLLLIVFSFSATNALKIQREKKAFNALCASNICVYNKYNSQGLWRERRKKGVGWGVSESHNSQPEMGGTTIMPVARTQSPLPPLTSSLRPTHTPRRSGYDYFTIVYLHKTT